MATLQEDRHPNRQPLKPAKKRTMNNFGIDPNVEATLEIWAWDEGGIKTIFDGLNKLYPNIKYNYVSVASADYLVKTQTAAAAGERVSDIVKGDGVWRGQALNLGIFANLEADPYNLDRSVIQSHSGICALFLRR